MRTKREINACHAFWVPPETLQLCGNCVPLFVTSHNVQWVFTRVSRGISIREFAKRDGCSSTLVKRGKDRGDIAAFADGSLDPSAVGSAWRESKRRAQKALLIKPSVHKARAQHEAPPIDATEEALAAAFAPGGVFATRAEAEKFRDSYIAHLRRIEYEQKSGQVVDVAKAVEQVEEAFSRVRTRLLAMPAEQAPALHRCKTVLELQDLMASLIVEVLEELSRGR